MSRPEKISYYCFLIFSLFICIESLRLGFGEFSAPGPGFLPFGTAVIIGILAIIRLVMGRGKKVASTEPFFMKERLFKFLWVVFICFGYGLLLYYIGFILCTGLFVLISLKTIEPKKWGHATLVSIATAFAAWLLFDHWLQIQAPKGVWVYPIYEQIKGLLWK